jgi:hypothetical protein
MPERGDDKPALTSFADWLIHAAEDAG